MTELSEIKLEVKWEVKWTIPKQIASFLNLSSSQQRRLNSLRKALNILFNFPFYFIL